MRNPETSRSVSSFARFAFCTFVLLYCVCLLYKPSFGLIDDHYVLSTFFAGKPLPLFYSATYARFAPMQGQEYNIVALFGHSPFSFYFLNALEFVVTAWLLVATAKAGMTNRNSIVPYVTTFLVLLTPGFIDAWFRLFVPERNEFLLLSVLLYFFLKYQEEQNYLYCAIGTLAAILALLCKETAFVIVGVLGLAHFLLDRHENSRKRLFDGMLCSMSAAWLAIYYFFIYRFRGTHVYGDRVGSKIHLYLKTIGSNAIHDPVVILGILLLLANRAFLLFKRKESNPVLDSILLAGTFFFLAYLALRMSNGYYLLPLYLFVPYVVCVVVSHAELKAIFKPWMLVVLCILFLSQLSLDVREFALLKFGPADFQATLNALETQISATPRPANIFLGGANKGTGIEVFSSLSEYLEFRKLQPGQFDLKSDLPIDDLVTFERFTPEIPHSSLSYLQPHEDDHISVGDLVLVTPYDSVNRQDELSDTSKYDLIFQTHSPALPDLSIKGILRALIKKARNYVAANPADPNFYLYKRIAPQASNLS